MEVSLFILLSNDFYELLCTIINVTIHYIICRNTLFVQSSSSIEIIICKYVCTILANVLLEYY